MSSPFEKLREIQNAPAGGPSQITVHSSLYTESALSAAVCVESVERERKKRASGLEYVRPRQDFWSTLEA